MEQDFASINTKNVCRYLEAQIQGSKTQSQDGTLGKSVLFI